MTGTPGTGKSTIGRLLENEGLYVLEIEKFARDRGIYSYIENGETLVLEIPELVHALVSFLRDRKEAIVIGHLSHHLPNAHAVVVLRTEPAKLERRLIEKGWSQQKISENVEAEALDILLCEALELYGNKVSEIVTSEVSALRAAEMLLEIHRTDKRYPPKAKNWLLNHILKRI